MREVTPEELGGRPVARRLTPDLPKGPTSRW